MRIAVTIFRICRWAIDLDLRPRILSHRKVHNRPLGAAGKAPVGTRDRTLRSRADMAATSSDGLQGTDHGGGERGVFWPARTKRSWQEHQVSKIARCGLICHPSYVNGLFSCFRTMLFFPS